LQAGACQLENNGCHVIPPSWSDPTLQLKIEFEAIAACFIPFISSSGGGSNIRFFFRAVEAGNLGASSGAK